MKFLVQFCIALFLSNQVLGQVEITFPDLKFVYELASDSVNFNTNNTIDIKGSHWDNQKYNPYKDELVKYPIQINFDDSLYSPPILKEMVVTSRYGWRHRRAHKGIDIDLVTGDKVVSILDGVVRLAKYNGGHGRTVVVRHYNGLESTYAHLSSYAVKANDTVKSGQLLGTGGTTGNTRGSHLHLVLTYKGIAINPEYLLNFKDTNEIRSSEIWVTRRWTTPYLHSSRFKTALELLTSEDEAIASLSKEKKIYIVKRGDTLSRISNRNNVSIRALCVANKIKSTSILRIGQKLVLGM